MAGSARTAGCHTPTRERRPGPSSPRDRVARACRRSGRGWRRRAGPAAAPAGWRGAWTPARARLWLIAAAVAAWLPLLGVPLRGWLDFCAFYAAGIARLHAAGDGPRAHHRVPGGARPAHHALRLPGGDGPAVRAAGRAAVRRGGGAARRRSWSRLLVARGRPSGRTRRRCRGAGRSWVRWPGRRPPRASRPGQNSSVALRAHRALRRGALRPAAGCGRAARSTGLLPTSRSWRRRSRACCCCAVDGRRSPGSRVMLGAPVDPGRGRDGWPAGLAGRLAAERPGLPGGRPAGERLAGDQPARARGACRPGRSICRG